MGQCRTGGQLLQKLSSGGLNWKCSWRGNCGNEMEAVL